MKLDGCEPLSRLRQYCLVAGKRSYLYPFALHFPRKILAGHGNSCHVLCWLPAVFRPPSLKHEDSPELRVPSAVAAKKACPHLPDGTGIKKLFLNQSMLSEKLFRPLP